MRFRSVRIHAALFLLLVGCQTPMASVAPVPVRSVRPMPVVIPDVVPEPDHEPSLGRVRVSFGANQAPYDDAPRSNGLLPTSARGFSGSVLRLEVGEPIGGGLEVTGGISAARYLDEPILSGIRDPELSWFSVGLRFSF